MTTETGSIPWFHRRKRSLLQDVCALDDFHAAMRHTARLLLEWDHDDELGELRGALFTAAVINYARPFLGSKTAYGGKVLYSIKNLRTMAGFERDLHKELLVLRHRLIAHDDGEAFPPRLFTTKVRVSLPKEEATAAPPFLATLCSSSLHSVSDKREIERIGNHIKVCVEAVAAKITSELTEYLREAALHPDEHQNSRESIAGSIPDVINFQPEQATGSVNTVMEFGNVVSHEAAMFVLPQAPIRHGHLVYRMLATSVQLPWVDIQVAGNSLRLHLSNDKEELQARIKAAPA